MVPWCTGNEVLERMGEDANQTGLSMGKVDEFARIASEVMFVLSGRQFRGERTRTVVVPVGNAFRGQARATISAWWPVRTVSDVEGLVYNQPPVALTDADWQWPGGATIRVPAWLAGQRLQATLVCGQAPSEMGRLAARALAIELAVNDPEYDGDLQTRLPSMMTSRSRQGISETFATVLDMMKEGATGIQEVDMFVSQYNVTKSRSRPRVRTMR